MLYLDSSAWMKRYVQELGSAALEQRLQKEILDARPLFTSTITYAEIHAALARRVRERFFTTPEFRRLRERFETEWAFSLTPINLEASVLLFVKNIVFGNPLKAADTIHLATALSLRDEIRLKAKSIAKTDKITFATSDKQLANAALSFSLEVFNPEDHP